MTRRLATPPWAAALVGLLVALLTSCGYALDTDSDQAATTVPPAGAAAPGVPPPLPTDTTAPSTTTEVPVASWCEQVADFFLLGQSASDTDDPDLKRSQFLQAVASLQAAQSTAPAEIGFLIADLLARIDALIGPPGTELTTDGIDRITQSFVEENEDLMVDFYNRTERTCLAEAGAPGGTAGAGG